MDAPTKVLSNRRLKNVEFDAIVERSEKDVIIVEIKYIQRGFHRGWVRESITNLGLKMIVYADSFQAETHGLLIVVIATSNSPLAHRVLTISDELSRASPSWSQNIMVRAIYEADIAAFKDSDLRDLILQRPRS